MSLKVVWKFIKSRFFWLNVAAALLLVGIGVVVTLAMLNRFTLHGEQIEVPDVSGLYTEEAELLLKQQGLTYEVVDSVYLRAKLPGEIIDQTPDAHSFVKLGRKIYLTINAKAEKMVVVPDVRNFPLRQARAALEAAGFRISSTIYRPSEYPDLVMDVQANDQPVAVGSKLRDGSALALIVGERAHGEAAYIPDLKGLTMSDAESSIIHFGFVLGATNFDENTNDADEPFVVYKQSPEAGMLWESGRRIDLWLTTNPNKLSEKTDKNGYEENFFD